MLLEIKLGIGGIHLSCPKPKYIMMKEQGH